MEEEQKREDKRTHEQLRAIDTEQGLLNRADGSARYTQGNLLHSFSQTTIPLYYIQLLAIIFPLYLLLHRPILFPFSIKLFCFCLYLLIFLSSYLLSSCALPLFTLFYVHYIFKSCFSFRPC